MPPGLSLPAGLTARAPTFADAGAVTEVVAACEADDLGRPEVDVEDIRADWRRGSFDLSSDAVVVVAGHALVAQAEVFRGRRAEANVHPGWNGRGIGSWLRAWTEARAHAVASDRIGQTLSDTSRRAVDLLSQSGYEPLYTAWVLEVELGAMIDVAPPEGIRIREFLPGRDDRVVYELIDDAFNEWPDREPSPFEDWAPRTIGWQGFEPWHLPLAVAGEEVVGAAHLIDYGGDFGWVNQLAVRAGFRNRGIARALLGHAFEAFRLRGKRACGLSTDSRTGALGLYERLGMQVSRSYTHHAKTL